MEDYKFIKEKFKNILEKKDEKQSVDVLSDVLSASYILIKKSEEELEQNCLVQTKLDNQGEEIKQLNPAGKMLAEAVEVFRKSYTQYCKEGVEADVDDPPEEIVEHLDNINKLLNEMDEAI